MTDLEKELVEKLAREWLTTHLDPRYANAEDVWRPNDVISLASVKRKLYLAGYSRISFRWVRAVLGMLRQAAQQADKEQP